MALSWNEIKDRAIAFSKEWKHEGDEDGEAKSFLDAFFNVFGITRRRVATFETFVHKDGNAKGRIDLLWKGQILIEMKSRGKNLDRAYKQATDYFPGLKEHELPKYILVCDFENFRLYDLDEDTRNDFLLKDFYKHTKLFGFIAGYQKKEYKEQDPVNIKAAELMGKLHDNLKALGYTGHELEVYLVRILYCLFADDTAIFETGIFHDYIQNKTKEDGSDLGMHLSALFEVLNTPPEKRMKSTDEDLLEFRYVNGKLFEEHLHMASFNSSMRKSLLDCCALNWGEISPAIFGSMFQSVMDEKARRNIGAHYTSEKNIMKVIKALFLDEYWTEFEKIKRDKKGLQKFHNKLASLKFLDPACGCGNFLVITYRELRLLELEILKVLQEGQQVTTISDLVKIDVDQFYGIEYEEFPAQIASVALWLMDHQMNLKVMEAFGFYSPRLPLKKSARIVHGNALRTDWHSLIDPMPWIKEPQVFNFIYGNPPFIGYAWQSDEQKNDMQKIWSQNKGAGVLDYVTCWYKKAAEYLDKHNTKDLQIRCAFVSTNSISQGEQVGILWSDLFAHHHIKIHFAHRTFSWNNEARGNAAVHVVIIGFSNYDVSEKKIYEYENIKGEPHEVKVKNINPYLLEGKDIFIQKRSTPICNVPEINRGSDAIDDGNLLLNEDERNELIKENPKAKKWIRPFLMGKEFLNNIPRYCLWLKGISPSELKEITPIYLRVQKVKEFRLKSKRPQTLKAANFPSLFGEERHPDSDYLAIPKVSSETRNYIPIGFCSNEIICGDKLFNLPNATLFHFGIITSLMHNTWMRYTCGRLESRYSYSNTIVYNNYPWPENPTEKQKQAIEKAAQKVLDVRAEFPESSLADLYDPLTMPPALVKAHNELDKAVDLSYRAQPFISETKRIEFLFELYEKYTAGMFAVVEGKGKKKKK